MDAKPLLAMNRRRLIKRIGNRFYGVRPYSGRICGICGRLGRYPKTHAAIGFAIAGWKLHAFACYEKALRKLGY